MEKIDVIILTILFVSLFFLSIFLAYTLGEQHVTTAVQWLRVLSNYALNL